MILILIDIYVLCHYRAYITEYGRVVTDDTSKGRDKRWYRTISSMFCHIDGNPAHQMNGGVTAMAHGHYLGSLANHSKQENAEYDVIFNTVTPRAFLEMHGNDEVGLWSCIVLRATQDIFPGHQILCNYEPAYARKLWIVFGNETFVRFLQDAVAAFQGKRDWFSFKSKAESE
jgi:hypothetical protein